METDLPPDTTAFPDSSLSILSKISRSCDPELLEIWLTGMVAAFWSSSFSFFIWVQRRDMKSPLQISAHKWMLKMLRKFHHQCLNIMAGYWTLILPIYIEKLSHIQTGLYFGKVLVLLDPHVEKLLLFACNITARILNIQGQNHTLTWASFVVPSCSMDWAHWAADSCSSLYHFSVLSSALFCSPDGQ